MEPTTLAEHALLAAVTDDRVCDFRTADERNNSSWTPTPDEAAQWTEERAVRAEYVQHLIVDERMEVAIRGARIDGHLKLRVATLTLYLADCILTGDADFAFACGGAWFAGTTFSGDVDFNGTAFSEDVSFNRATFSGKASFIQATFAKGASFNRVTFSKTAGFTGAAFSAHAGFDAAKFAEAASFLDASFYRGAQFRGTTFADRAGFAGVCFYDSAGFGGAEFHEGVLFAAATFSEDVKFAGVEFSGATGFGGATFSGYASFAGATFSGDFVDFSNVRARSLSWTRTRWSAGVVDMSGLAAIDIDLEAAVFEVPMRLDLAAAEVAARRLRSVGRLHLVAAGAAIDLTDADLAPGSLIETTALIPVRPPANRHRHVERYGYGGTWLAVPAVDYDWRADEQRNMLTTIQWARHLRGQLRLDQDLTQALPVGREAAIKSVSRTSLAGVTVSGLNLRSCIFSDANGLDELTIAGSAAMFASSRESDQSWPWWRRWLARCSTERRVIHDEIQLRRGNSGDLAVEDEEDMPSDGKLTSRAVSATYRSLRKALEDNKDEPGAADFYYGEMEMRRHAAAQNFWERTMLILYRVVSGYGLRAWRAIATLAVVVVLAGLCFTNGAWAAHKTTTTPTSVNLETGDILSTAPTPDRLSLGDALLFAVQEAVVLFRPAGQSSVALTGVGHVVDLAIRVLGPTIIALAVLAIRNRVKR